ncbi:MAG: GTPase [Candidatus Diapherotrites archaeon]
MTTNVSIEYANAQDKLDRAKTPYEKLAALEEMKSYAPSHKGAEKLRAEINHKIAQLKLDIEKDKKQSAKRGGGPTLAVKKEGAGQIVLVGLPNAGKSTLFNALTGLNAPVGDYEYTTVQPQVGMVDFKGAKIQLVDLPPISEGSAEGKFNGKEILAVIRNADAIVLVVRAENPAHEYLLLQKELEKAGISLNRKKPNVSITPTPFPGFSLTGKEFLKIPQEQLVEYLKKIGMHNVHVILRENTTLDVVAEVLNEKLVYRKAMIIVMKSVEKKETKRDEKGLIVFTWQDDKESKKEAVDLLFEILDKVFVYTKKPGTAAATLPLIVPKGATVLNVAELIHKDIVQTLKSAKIWGSTKFEGQRVAKDYVVQNGDIVEFCW